MLAAQRHVLWSGCEPAISLAGSTEVTWPASAQTIVTHSTTDCRHIVDTPG